MVGPTIRHDHEVAVIEPAETLFTPGIVHYRMFQSTKKFIEPMLNQATSAKELRKKEEKGRLADIRRLS